MFGLTNRETILMFELNEHGGWIVPASTTIPASTAIPARSALGDYCELGDNCKLGDGCELGAGCKLGNYCELEGKAVSYYMTAANIDGTGRQVLLILSNGEVYVRCGCFFGTADDLCAKAASEGKRMYVAVISSLAKAIKDEHA